MQLVNVKQDSTRLPPRAALRIGLGILLVIALAGAGLLAYVWFSGGTGQASRAVTAPSLQVGGTTRLFRIQPADSEVRFIITETLLGQPKTVVGATKEVAGDIAVDFDRPTASRVGVIRINVRTLQTDNEIRNRTLRGQILQANQVEYEFASFVPKRLTDLPDQIQIGQPFSFHIVGDLTVRNVTREVIFEATINPISRERIQGSARATIHYHDLGLSVPDAPGVANVSEAVRLEIDLVASAVGSAAG